MCFVLFCSFCLVGILLGLLGGVRADRLLCPLVPGLCGRIHVSPRFAILNGLLKGICCHHRVEGGQSPLRLLDQEDVRVLDLDLVAAQRGTKALDGGRHCSIALSRDTCFPWYSLIQFYRIIFCGLSQ